MRALLLLPLFGVLVGCETTKEFIKPQCPASITAPVPDEPIYEGDEVVSLKDTTWFLGAYQPAFHNMQDRLKQAQEWCVQK